MKISTKGRYGLRTMLELALHYGEGPVSRSQIAESHDLSPKYMHTLLTSLMSDGLVRSHRGNVGGYTLSKAPEDIPLIEIIESLEGSVSLVACVGSDNACDKAVTCATQEIWSEASSALKEYFSNRTLLDVVNSHKKKN